MMKRLVEKTTAAFAYISAAIFAVIVLVVLANIISRGIFNHPIKGVVEIVQYGVMFCAGIVMCRSGLEERHICVTFLIDKYPRKVRAGFVAFGKLLGTMTFCTLAGIYSGEISEAAMSGTLTDTFRLPLEYIYVIMALCFAASALIFLYQFFLCMSDIWRSSPPEDPTGGAEAEEAFKIKEIEDNLV